MYRGFQALPAYFGGKRKLCPLIFAALGEVLARESWAEATFLDPFCGGGAVSLYAKAQGFRVLASDQAERAAVVARALVANSSVRLRFDDIVDLFREPVGDYPEVASKHSPAVFTADEANWLDRALARARPRSEPVRSLLLLLIVKAALRCQPMSMLRGTDAKAAATGDLDRVSPRRLGHYLKAGELFRPEGVWRLAQEVNGGVFGGRGKARRGDALDVIGSSEADVVYLDPPYPGTTGYEREYRVLDEMLGDQAANGSMPSLSELLESSSHVPLLVLSYGGPQVSLAAVTGAVGRFRQVVLAIQIPYAHLASISKRRSNEYLVVARG